jgi:hypothetical protein
MNPYVIEVHCDVCGEGGMATMNDAGNQWIGGQLRHTDPNVCAMNLKRRKEELDRRESKQCQGQK